MVARRAHNPEAVGSNPAPATKESHPRQNALGLLISTYPSDCNGSGDLPSVQVSAVRCTQIALKPVYVQLRLDIKNKGSVKNVGVEDTPRISEPLSFFEKTLFSSAPTGVSHR